MARTLTAKLIESHLVDGSLQPGTEIGLRIDQALTQDATGTLVMLELEAMDLDQVHCEVAVQYVDHNLLQEDFKNPDDHLFLESACRRFGFWFSRPGNGVSHPVHQERFGKPGQTLIGSDSHTPAAGSIGMLALGAGGLDVATAIAGIPVYIPMPEVWGVHLTGTLPDWVSAKDVILEMLRRYDVDEAVGCVLEYFGPGLECLSAMDRHVIANMGTELGATTSVFPSDDEIRRFLRSQDREEDWIELHADDGCHYDRMVEIDLSQLEPLIAMPSSPGNVVPVRDVVGREIYQAYIGSSANPGYRDFAIAAEIVAGQQVHPRVSFDINPTSRQMLVNLMRDGQLATLIAAGARLHQAGCNGCIGMGQAPATGMLSLRTVPRNFPGRSGTRDDQVCLVSPETAAASALTGQITDPRTLDHPCPQISQVAGPVLESELLEAPRPAEEAHEILLRKGPNIASLPDFEPFPETLEAPVLLKVGDNISTDGILPAGARVLPYRSNIPKLAEFAFRDIDENYYKRASQVRENNRDRKHVLIAGSNYGQGSSREHAALVLAYLGLRLVVAKSFARIHWQNLVNFGILPVTFDDPADYNRIERHDLLRLPDTSYWLHESRFEIDNQTRNRRIAVSHTLSERQRAILESGGLIRWIRLGHAAVQD